MLAREAARPAPPPLRSCPLYAECGAGMRGPLLAASIAQGLRAEVEAAAAALAAERDVARQALAVAQQDLEAALAAAAELKVRAV